MIPAALHRQFASIGARLRLRPLDVSQRVGPLALDIGRDRRGELFDIQISQEVPPELLVLQLDRGHRHLLLLSREVTGAKHRFLCGHDERHWFVAAIPESRPVSTVIAAMDALRPKEAEARLRSSGMRWQDRHRRRNAAYLRQGEWFFLPSPRVVIPDDRVLKHEPLRRGRGKDHLVQWLSRLGGEPVYACRRHPKPLTVREYQQFLSKNSEARHWPWQLMRRNPQVYARGTVRHPDHATLHLENWHRVVMNTESQADAMHDVAFLD